ncbi:MULTISPECIES: NADPH-dependent FMN reductase [Fictibacillus]|uniref:FMN-dependent NADH-azoreductase n=1 Tax=Fictibacillus enclensis TaxID=1017270 RepID=A0A0V8JB85_9BACL|nr:MULTISPECIES: NADPH-dependent FMN reductase [Fictibacillus]KSU84235.1 FMN-dependent NADH-azoreductase [Fictibacillus enclensis]RXZ00147.1 NAD(P)H-dependent oxidoreductase [Fictibacillus sp. S7]SCB75570.1 azobenzene reductase [Fictibacillus enclensis]
MKILVMNGSPTAESRTRGIAEYAANVLQEKGVEVTFFDAGKDRLPLYTGDTAEQENEAVQKLIQAADEAQGFFICTPEYHNGMSGALKNALDFLTGNQFKNKPVVITAAAGGGKGGINALNNLRTVMRGLYSLVIADQFVADPIHFNDERELTEELATLRVNSLIDQLMDLTKLVSSNSKN